jgi:deoxyribonuclease V
VTGPETSFGIEQARAAQRDQTDRVRLVSDDRPICGLDIAYATDSDRLVAATAVLGATTLEPVKEVAVEGLATVPYVLGLLSFREARGVLAALSRRAAPPELVVCDEQDVAHPVRFGPACHIGVDLDLPSIGYAKTYSVGDYERR